MVCRNFTIGALIIIAAIVTNSATAHPHSFRIGVECGPLHGVGDKAGYGIMPPNNPRFYQNQYFYSSLVNGYFDYDRLKKEQKELYDTGGNQVYGEICNIFQDMDSLDAAIYPDWCYVDDPEIVDPVKFSLYCGWAAGNSDTLATNDDAIPNLRNPWDYSFFETDFAPPWNVSGIGNAIDFEDLDLDEDEPYDQNWQTTSNPGDGFIIGKAGEDNIEDAFMSVRWHEAFSLVNNGTDNYELRLLMKAVNLRTDSTDRPLCTLYIKKSGETVHQSKYNRHFDLDDNDVPDGWT